MTLSKKNGLVGLLIPSLLLLNACSTDQGDGSKQAIGGGTPLNYGIAGSVLDGPVINATVQLSKLDGEIIESTTSDSNAQYNFNLKNRLAFPITVKASGGTDTVSNSAPEFSLSAIVFENHKNIVNINSFSTLVHRITLRLGLSMINYNQATRYVTQNLNFGLDINSLPNPSYGVVNDANASNLLRSNEALASMIKETAAVISAQSSSQSADQILDAIAADMVDGKLDGQGESEASDRIAATANLVSAKIILQSLTNSLSNQSQISAALVLLSENSSLSNAAISQEGIKHSLITLVATREFLSQQPQSAALTTALGQLDDTINKLRSFTGSTPQQLAQHLGTLPTSAVDLAINSIPNVNSSDLVVINTRVRDGIPQNNNFVPVAQTDNVNVDIDNNASQQINVLANDTPGNFPVNISIQNGPENGSVSVNNNIIQYTPNPLGLGNESFTYILTDNDGEISVGTVNVNATCSQCANNVDILLSWDATNSQPVSGYRIYGGSDMNSADNFLRQVSSANLSINAGLNLGLKTSNNYCFKVSAYNNAGESTPTTAQCITVQ